MNIEAMPDTRALKSQWANEEVFRDHFDQVAFLLAHNLRRIFHLARVPLT
jgi:hypothetical protein